MVRLMPFQVQVAPPEQAVKVGAGIFKTFKVFVPEVEVVALMVEARLIPLVVLVTAPAVVVPSVIVRGTKLPVSPLAWL